jgi:hypothetical protein
MEDRERERERETEREREEGTVGQGPNIPFKGMPSVTYLLLLGPAS